MRLVPATLALLVCTSLTSWPPAAAAAALCDGRVATITGTAADDVLVGTVGADVIAGLGGDDTISGLDGADVLCGHDGADTLVGGAGGDRLLGGRDAVVVRLGVPVLEGVDTVRPGAGDDFVDLGDDPRDPGTDLPGEVLDYGDVAHGIVVDLAAGTALADGTDTVVVADVLRVVGTPYGDTMRGSSLEDWLCAGAGDDLLTGGPGPDVLDADGSLGDDCDVDGYPYATGSGDDTVRGGPGRDVVFGGGGSDDLRGEGGRDSLEAGPGSAAVILGGPGGDSVHLKVERRSVVDVRAGRGRDSLAVGRSRAWRRTAHRVSLSADLGRGRLASGGRLVARVDSFAHLLVARGSNDAWTIRGTPGRNRLIAVYARGPVHSSGLGGDDVLVGGRRDDVLDGGPGEDRLNGIRGVDTCTNGERYSLCEHRS
jgi:Ca2+-binding RTX toxin-like protein